MKHQKRRILALIMAFLFSWGTIATGFADSLVHDESLVTKTEENSDLKKDEVTTGGAIDLEKPPIPPTEEPKLQGYVTISVEKFTLGQGYYREPRKVPFYEGDNGADILTRLIGEGNYQNTGSIKNSFYLASIKDNDSREANIPKYIRDHVEGDVGEKSDPDWLGEFDYTSMSGWMYAVNNKFPNVGCSQYRPHDGDVVRWQFTVYGYGADLGASADWGDGNYIEVANKDRLTAKIGEINSSAEKDILLSKSHIKKAYDKAIEVLQNMEETQSEVDKTLEELETALNYTGPPLAGTVTLSIEKFTLGQGYVKEPKIVEFYEGEKVGQVISRVLGKGNFNNGSEDENISYLANLKDQSDGNENIPNYIKEKVKKLKGRKSQEWLGERDYTSMSGWMYIVNNKMASVGMGSYDCKDNDVIRLQFTVYGYGMDLGFDGFGSGQPYIQAANKDLLTQKIAQINSNESEKEAFLADKNKEKAYQNALKVLKNMESTQSEVDKALLALDTGLVITTDYKEHLNKSLSYIASTVSNPTSGSVGGDWAILALARGEYPSLDEYYNKYYSNIEKRVKDSKGILSDSSYTEYSRTIIGLSSIGKDSRNVAGYNLVENIANYDKVVGQGINGAIFGLIAIDTGKYELKDKDIRIKLIDFILSKEIKKGTSDAGGWAFFGGNVDPDITAMAIQSLAPYYDSNNDVKLAVDRAISKLSSLQNAEGGFTSWGSTSSESIAQVIVALSSLKIDSQKDERFIKNGNSLIDALMEFSVPEGGFVHVKGSENKANSMATEQGTYALVAYDRFLNNKTSLYDMSEGIKVDIPKKANYEIVLSKSLNHIYKNLENPSIGTNNGEWSILCLARGNYNVPKDYFEKYFENVKKEIFEKKGKLTKNKYTEYSRLILGVTSIGKDPKDIAGYNQLEKLSDYNSVIIQGINGPIFALIALDTNKYELPVVEGVKVQSSREKFIDYILSKEIKKGTPDAGGWALSGNNPDPDITAMAIQSLTPYYNSRQDVKNAVERGIETLSKMQGENGGYTSWGSNNSESVAQVIVALSGLKIDSNTDSRFIKNGNSALEALLSFSDENGGFLHVKSGDSGNGGAQPGIVDPMATDQGTYALIAYDRFLNNNNSLYDMTDVKKDEKEKDDEFFEVPSGSEFTADLSNKDQKKNILINIEKGQKDKVRLKLSNKKGMPKTEVKKDKTSVKFERGTKVVSGNSQDIELIGENLSKEDFKEKVSKVIPKEKKLTEIEQIISMGTQERVEFDEYVTITFEGMGNKEVAYNENGEVKPIKKYTNVSEVPVGSQEFAYSENGNLIVKTKHFTDYILYSTEDVKNTGNQGSGGTGGGGGATTPTNKVTLSVDKITIKKGYVISPVEIELKDGDTAWSVLQRELDKRGIVYKYEWTPKYGSIYVQSMDNDGEFDNGSGSGWMYNVNGWYPNYGSSKYILKDKDVLQWRYTTDLGADLGEDLSKWETPGTKITVKSGEKNPILKIGQDVKEDQTIQITKELIDTDSITIEVPKIDYRIILNLEEVKDNIPKIIVKLEDKEFILEKGSKILSGNTKVEVFTNIKDKDGNIEKTVKENIRGQLNAIDNIYYIGSRDKNVILDKAATILFKNKKGKSIALYEKDKFKPILFYNNEEEALKLERQELENFYGITKDEDLSIKTALLGTFIQYDETKEEVAEAPKEKTLEDLYKDADMISSWARNSMLEASKNGILVGSDGKVRPKTGITRGEFARILIASMNLKLEDSNTIIFNDVPKDNIFYPYIITGYKNGIMSGYGQNFNPNGMITREEMAVMITNAMKLNSPVIYEELGFEDSNDISSWAKEAVKTVVNSKVMVGYNNEFRPKDIVTREMAVAVVMKGYKNKEEKQVETAEAKNYMAQRVLENVSVEKYITETSAIMKTNVPDPVVASVGGEWTVLSLARGNISVPEKYYEKYYSNLDKKLKETSGKLHNVKYTEYDRVILALTATGKDPRNFNGYDLTKPLADFNTVIKQGLNGPIWALIALDTKGYEIPLDTKVKVQTSREMLINYILEREIPGGGWSLTSKAPADVDITAMAIQALAKYKSDPKVNKAINRALNFLSKNQLENGYFPCSWGDEESSESIAQVIVALTSLGIDPAKDKRFIKGDKNLISSLLDFYVPNGGFRHVKSDQLDGMATDQGMYALIAYDRFTKGKKALYDMTDVK